MVQKSGRRDRKSITFTVTQQDKNQASDIRMSEYPAPVLYHDDALINESPRYVFRRMGGESCDRHLIYPCHVIFIDLKVEYFGVFDYALFMY